MYKGKTMARMFNRMFWVLMLAVVSGCSGSDSGSSPSPSPSPQLVAISIQAENVSVPLGTGYQFSATGTYSDHSSANLTTSVTWSSSNPAVATIGNTAGNHGMALSVAGGTTTITASSGGVLASTVLNVVPIGGTTQGTPLQLAGNVTTLAGAAANFNLPVGITTDGRNLYIADSNNNTIRKIVISTATVSTVAGSGLLGTVDGTGAAARFYHPRGITTDGTCLYVAELESNSIRKVVIATGEVTTLATLSSPAGITTDGINLYVTDSARHTIRKIVISTGTVTILAGSDGIPGSADGAGSGATFNQPVGITTDGISLYVNDFGSGKIRKIVLAGGVVSTVASGFVNPASGITTDGTSLYVADYGNNTIRKIVISSGSVSLLAGVVMGFNHPEGVTSDGTSLFIADSDNNAIRKMN